MAETPTRLRLAEILDEIGWTQKRLSEATGISEQSISNLVRNPRSVRFETLDAIARATGKSVFDLLIEDK